MYICIHCQKKQAECRCESPFNLPKTYHSLPGRKIRAVVEFHCMQDLRKTKLFFADEIEKFVNTAHLRGDRTDRLVFIAPKRSDKHLIYFETVIYEGELE